jgi:tetratricopeptide (TPR) repeat protein
MGSGVFVGRTRLEDARAVADYDGVTVGAAVDAARAELADIAERVLALGHQTDDQLWISWAENNLASLQEAGETPVADCLQWHEQRPQVQRRSPGRAAVLLAMLGRFDEAHAALAAADERRAETGSAGLGNAWMRVIVAGLEGDWAGADAAAERACEFADQQGMLTNVQVALCRRAEALIELGRLEEAARCLDRAEEVAPIYDREAFVMTRALRARLLAEGGTADDAERLAREAVAFADTTDVPDLRGEARLALAEVLARAGKDARPELERALADYERKGNLVMAERTRARLAEASAPA